MRLIDADKFLSIMKVLNCNLLRLKDIENYIEIYGTVDPASLKEHARWEISLDGYYPYCSKCNEEPKNGVMSNYCPNCGAKMDLEGK